MSAFLLFIKRPMVWVIVGAILVVGFFVNTYKSNSSKVAELEYKEEVRIEIDKIEKQQDVVQEEITTRKRDMVEFEKELPEQVNKEIGNVKKDTDKSYIITADDANNSLQ